MSAIVAENCLFNQMVIAYRKMYNRIGGGFKLDDWEVEKDVKNLRRRIIEHYGRQAGEEMICKAVDCVLPVGLDLI